MGRTSSDAALEASFGERAGHVVVAALYGFGPAMLATALGKLMDTSKILHGKIDMQMAPIA